MYSSLSSSNSFTGFMERYFLTMVNYPVAHHQTKLSSSSKTRTMMMFNGSIRNIFIFFLILVLMLIQQQLVSSQSVNFTDCGDGNVKDVRIYPCVGNQPTCIIQLGTNVTVEADFIAPINANSLSEVIKGVIRGREMPFPDQRVDPCTTGTIYPSCPIIKGENYQFKTWFEVKPFYPPMSIKVRYSLTDPTGYKIACVQVATKIVDPMSKTSQRARNRSKSMKNHQRSSFRHRN